MAAVSRAWARRSAFALLAAAAAGIAGPSATAGAASLEYVVKANFLYKFAPFVSWPPEAFASDRAPFTICVAGADPFGPALDGAVRGQRIGAHPIAVRRIQRLDGAAGCHIVFAAGSRTQTTAEILRAVGRQPVLTVSDEQPGASDSMIRFVIRDGRVRFIINRAAADGAGMTISSKLLDLAVLVEH